jgi:EmrB/QacA subfamily drug resistance transporter
MLAGAAWSLGSLIFFRILQGLGGGMIMPVGMTLLTRAAGREHVGRAMGALGVQQLLGPVLGPIIGGVLVEDAGWRWIFYVNVPIGAVAVVAAARFLPPARPRPCERLDVRGLLLLSPGIATLVYGLAEVAQADGAADPRTLVPLLVGAVLLTAFGFHARRARNALVDVRLFRRRGFSAGVAASFFISMALFGAMFVLPLYYQRARGLSPLDAGLLLAPQGIGAAIMMPLAGRLTDRLGPGRVVIGGLGLVLAGTLPFAVTGGSAPYPLLALALVVRGLGLGASTMPAMAGAYATLEADAVAKGAGLLNVTRRIGASVGVALLAVVLERQSAAPRGGQPESVAVLAGAYVASFWWLAGFCALALIAAGFLPRRPAVEEPDPHTRARPRRGLRRGPRRTLRSPPE